MKPKGFVRRTRQREVILEVLRGTDCHPTADWVYQEVRKEMPHVSLGTIYRNLKTLSEHGEIQELAFGSTHSRFDARVFDSWIETESLKVPLGAYFFVKFGNNLLRNFA